MEIVEIFTIGFFIKSYYFNKDYFQVLQSALLKNEKEIFSKKMQATEVLFDITREKQNIEKREIKTENKKNSKKNDFTFRFLHRKIYILLENIFGKRSLYCYICITVFSCGRLIAMQ